MTMLNYFEQVARSAGNMEAENDAFMQWLKQQPAAELDERVHRLQAAITPGIDCRLCGNCCRQLMINVEAGEAEPVAAALDIPVAVFKSRYIEESAGGMWIMNKIPCHFLDGNQCTVYAQRFDGCRAFPHLHQPDVRSRLFSLFFHYGSCAIIYEVMQALKQELAFEYTAP